jgi:hypothetical protein
MRRAVLVVALLLAVAAPAQARSRVVDRGVVIRVRPFAIVLQELDGTRARIPISLRTVVTLDGRPATLRELRRGDVAFVLHFGDRPALRIRAFSR